MRIPVGRYRSICMFGFNFHEFVEYIKGEEPADFLRSAPKKIPASRHNLFLELFDEYMQAGGYPEAVKAYAAREDPFEIMDKILDTTKYHAKKILVPMRGGALCWSLNLNPLMLGRAAGQPAGLTTTPKLPSKTQ